MRFSLQYLVSFTSLSVCEWVCFVCQLNLFFCHFIVIYESNAVELWWKILDNSISTAQSDDAFLDVCGDNIRHISKSMWNAFYQFDIWYDGFKWRSYTRLCVSFQTIFKALEPKIRFDLEVNCFIVFMKWTFQSSCADSYQSLGEKKLN